MSVSTPPSTGPDEVLVRRARQGDAGAFDLLIERHFGVAYAIAYARLGHRESAEDLAQEVFLRAWLQLASLRDDARFAAWVSLMARNLAIDWQRRGLRKSRLLPLVQLEDTVESQIADPSKNAGEVLVDQEENHLLQKAILALPPELREVVLLHHGEDLSKSEIARRMNVHPSTIGRQLDQATDLLKGIVEKTLRAGAKSLRPRRTASARAIAVIALTATLTPSAKAALVQQAVQHGGNIAIASATAACAKTGAAVTSTAVTTTGAASGGAQGMLGGIKSTLSTIGIGKCSGIATCVIGGFLAVGAVTGGAYFYSQHARSTESAFVQLKAPAPTTTIEKDYTFGGELSVPVTFGQRYRLKVSENPLKLKELGLQVERDGTIFVTSTTTNNAASSATHKIDLTKVQCYLPESVMPGISASIYWVPGSNGGSMVYWTNSHPQTLKDEQKLIRSYLRGEINVRQYRQAYAAVLRTNGVGPANAEHREAMYAETEKSYPAPTADMLRLVDNPEATN